MVIRTRARGYHTLVYVLPENLQKTLVNPYTIHVASTGGLPIALLFPHLVDPPMKRKKDPSNCTDCYYVALIFSVHDAPRLTPHFTSSSLN